MRLSVRRIWSVLAVTAVLAGLGAADAPAVQARNRAPVAPKITVTRVAGTQATYIVKGSNFRNYNSYGYVEFDEGGRARQGIAAPAEIDYPYVMGDGTFSFQTNLPVVPPCSYSIYGYGSDAQPVSNHVYTRIPNCTPPSPQIRTILLYGSENVQVDGAGFTRNASVMVDIENTVDGTQYLHTFPTADSTGAFTLQTAQMPGCGFTVLATDESTQVTSNLVSFTYLC